MIKKKKYRKGAIGALMDEYERASMDLKNLVAVISVSDFEKIIDLDTKDEDCRSVQAVVSHIINSGYGYANYIREWFTIPFNSSARRLYKQNEFNVELDKMLVYTAETLQDKWTLSDIEIMKVKISSQWSPEYDLEQLLEHAIVHVLRHRRQIEKFTSTSLIKLS
jgi:uncharacterized damage-inducible protein DinB